jgi:Protein of unknown function (DUF4058)
MPSPFPGMDPYLEHAAHWQDFHTEFLATVRRALTPLVGPKYFVQLEEHVYIHDLPSASRTSVGRADVSVARSRTSDGGSTAMGVLEAPVEVDLPEQDEERIRFLEIRDRRGRELVAVIELLSPSNKRLGEDRELYLAKRREMLRTPAHLVEIDLLRGWAPMPVRNRPVCDYSVMVSRAERRPKAGFWSINLRERLPVIPVPLRLEDGDARIDLQAALDSAYEAAAYERFIYEVMPEPALRPEDAAWAGQVLLTLAR